MSSRASPLSVTGYLLLGALGVLGIFLVLRGRGAAAPPSDLPVRAFVPPTLAARPTPGPRSSVATLQPTLPPHALERAPPVTVLEPGLPESEAPHPISAAHLRIFEENVRIAALNGALDRQDSAQLRSLNADYRRKYPEDEQVLQEGYDLIADCLQERTAPVVQAALRFWQERRSSSLRRYVRRHCLSGVLP